MTLGSISLTSLDVSGVDSYLQLLLHIKISKTIFRIIRISHAYDYFLVPYFK